MSKSDKFKILELENLCSKWHYPLQSLAGGLPWSGNLSIVETQRSEMLTIIIISKFSNI